MAMKTGAAPAREAAAAACERLATLLERAGARERLGDHTAARAGEDRVRIPLSTFALSLVRMRFQPALDPGWLSLDPVQVVLFGATNSGKSTVLNLLLGRPAAGMSFRARFSQHPEAYRLPALGNRFLDGFASRFAGFERHFDRHPPRQEDDALRAHGYHPALAINDPARLPGPVLAPPAVRGAVLWDVPDFSTEEAQAYFLPAVLDTIALADLVVMTVTRENYADHRGALLRSLVVESGIPLRVVANKLEEPGGTLLEDIRRKLGGDGAAIDGRVAPRRVHPLPQVGGDDELGRLAALAASPEVESLRRAVADDAALGPNLKRHALRGTLAWLDRRLDDALAPLWRDVEAADRWRALVESVTRREFFARYRREYLDGERYVDFNQALVKLMDLLEIPGIGPIISGVSRGLKAVSGWVVRGVERVFRGLTGRGTEPPRRGPELEAVAAAFEAWIEHLRGEAQVLADREDDPTWREIARTLAGAEFLHQLADTLGAAYTRYRAEMDEITGERARALYDLIAQRPRLLNTLRGVKVTLDVGTTALIVHSGGLNWTDAVIGPLVAPVQRLILEFGLGQFLAAQKAQLKEQQLAALRQIVEARMVLPVIELYRGGARRDELQQARRDLDAIRAALAPVAAGAGDPTR